MTDVGRRAFLGVAAAAPVLAAGVGQQMALDPVTAAVEASVFPTPAVPLGAGAMAGAERALTNAGRHLAESAGIGPWLKRGMDEVTWKAKRHLLNKLSQVHERLSYRDDPSINSMKSWSPVFKDTMKHLYREEVAAMMGALREELFGSQDGPANY